MQIRPNAGFRLSQPGAGPIRGFVRTGNHLVVLDDFDVSYYGLLVMRSSDSILVEIDGQDVIRLERHG